MSKNPTYNKLIRSKTWQKVRAIKIQRNPLCEECQKNGLVTQATEVHHIHPVEEGLSVLDMKRLCFSYTNLMSLCSTCHEQKHREMCTRSKEGVRERTRKGVEEFRKIFFE